MSRSRKKPRRGVNLPLSEAYDRFIRETPIGQRIEQAEIFARWEEIVGPTLATHFQPLTIAQGVLTLQFQNHTWAQEMQWKNDRLLKALNARLTGSTIREIRFRFGRKAPKPSTQPRARAAANPQPQPPPEEAIGMLEDSRLRDAFQSLARSLESQKGDRDST